MFIKEINERQTLIIPGDLSATVLFCREHFIKTANNCIDKKGSFSVALSGGTTPLNVYNKFLVSDLDWQKVNLFWSDERCVPLDNKESNYFQAMESGFKNLPIPKEHIFPMYEHNTKLSAILYDELMHTYSLDLILLGLGIDGHTASLFTETKALNSDKLAVENFIAQLNSWRITLTLKCINSCSNIYFYVFGAQKAQILYEVLYSSKNYPAALIGSLDHKAYFIADTEAAVLC